MVTISFRIFSPLIARMTYQELGPKLAKHPCPDARGTLGLLDRASKSTGLIVPPEGISRKRGSRLIPLPMAPTIK
jgi:hypothetical protein